MEHEVRKLQSIIDELTRRIERQEWRIVDLEKRLVPQDAMQQDIPSDKDSDYKEPILKRASPGTLAKKKRSNFLVWLLGLAGLCAVAGFVAMSYL